MTNENEIEEEMVEGTEEFAPTSKQMTEEFSDLSVDFKEKFFRFNMLAEQLGKKGLKRVLKALAAHPLETGARMQTGQEAAVFSLGTDMMDIKINMIIQSLRQDAMDELAEIEANKAVDVEEES